MWGDRVGLEVGTLDAFTQNENKNLVFFSRRENTREFEFCDFSARSIRLETAPHQPGIHTPVYFIVLCISWYQKNACCREGNSKMNISLLFAHPVAVAVFFSVFSLVHIDMKARLCLLWPFVRRLYFNQAEQNRTEPSRAMASQAKRVQPNQVRHNKIRQSNCVRLHRWWSNWIGVFQLNALHSHFAIVPFKDDRFVRCRYLSQVAL